MGQPLFEYRLRVGGAETRVLELEGSGPPVIMLHGYSDSADTWRTLLDRLGRSGQRAVAIDLPGFGEAPRLAKGPIVPQLDEFVEASIKQFTTSSERAVLVGNSLGGALALRQAGRRNRRVGAVMPIAPAGLDHPRWFEVLERDQILGNLFALPLWVPEAVVRQVVGNLFVQLAFSQPRAVDPKVVDNFTKYWNSRSRVHECLGLARQFVTEFHDPEFFQFESVRCPVAAVWGEKDRLVFVSGAERLLRKVPHVETVVLPRIGHMAHIEAAPAVAGSLTELIAKANAGTSVSRKRLAA